MRLFGIGPTEFMIIAVILLINLVPAVLGGIGMYRIAKRVGYEGRVSTLWAIGYALLGWIIVLIVSFLDWPQDRASTAEQAALEPQQI